MQIKGNDIFADNRRDEVKILSSLRKIVKGEYRDLAGVNSPELEAAGILLQEAGIAPSCPVLGALFEPSIRMRNPLVRQVMNADGQWVIVQDSKLGAVREGLWILCACDRPAGIIEMLGDASRSDGVVLVRPVKGRWIVAIPGGVLKGIVKNTEIAVEIHPGLKPGDS